MPRKLKVPSYRRLKSRNLAFTEIEGKRTYLGKWESPESKVRYEDIVREWLAFSVNLRLCTAGVFWPTRSRLKAWLLVGCCT